ncbi:flavin reductase family protein [Microbacterium kribbense]|uniref:Flavin reductase family protein n=1 Tax=Microbacterium kribbense TaxID=433645 RepID=A0ABP7GIY7_9MICO
MPSSAEHREHVLSEAPTQADADAYKLRSTLVAKGVGVVTAVAGRWDHAVTVTDFLSVSYDPPTIVVSLYELSRIADAVTDAGRFGLSLLATDQRRIADWLGEQGAPLPGLLDQVPHFRRQPGAPALIEGALAWFDLRVVAVHTAATHRLVVGEVTAMSESVPWALHPLVRWRSQYGP